MASLSSSTPSLHKDVRSESRSYKRDRDHHAKWSQGYRALPGAKQEVLTDELKTGYPEQQSRWRPERQHNAKECYSCTYFKYNGRKATSHKADVLHEISTGSNLSRSLSELLSNSFTDARSPDADIMYSFDAPTAPRKTVELDGLIAKAEKEWNSRETDKIVKNEYAVLDGRGELQLLNKGKAKKNSPRPRALSVVSSVQDEDDWERI